MTTDQTPADCPYEARGLRCQCLVEHQPDQLPADVPAPPISLRTEPRPPRTLFGFPLEVSDAAPADRVLLVTDAMTAAALETWHAEIHEAGQLDAMRSALEAALAVAAGGASSVVAKQEVPQATVDDLATRIAFLLDEYDTAVRDANDITTDELAVILARMLAPTPDPAAPAGQIRCWPPLDTPDPHPAAAELGVLERERLGGGA